MSSLIKKTAKKLINFAINFTHYYLLFERTINAYRGVFNSFEEALNAVPKKFNKDYNPELYQSPLKEVELGKDLKEKFNDEDYPVIFWLESIVLNGLTLLDLGGNVGLSYYTYRKYINYPDDFSWIVYELPEAVKAGEKLAKKADQTQQLSFTSDLKEVKNPDILLTCGTLQYLEKSLAKIMEESNFKPQYLFVQRVPFHEEKEYITLQNLGSSAVPYKIQNRTQFVNEICSLGYELIDSWKNDRTCFIPFYPEYFVDGYSGFYFKKKS